jgi:hypothetical protein
MDSKKIKTENWRKWYIAPFCYDREVKMVMDSDGKICLSVRRSIVNPFIKTQDDFGEHVADCLNKVAELVKENQELRALLKLERERKYNPNETPF